MSTIKFRNFDESYTCISNSVLQMKGISLEALGLWTHCISRPHDWTFHIKQLATHFGVGTKKIYKSINELIGHRLAFRGQRMNSKEKSLAGKRKTYAGVEYIISNKPLTDANIQDLENEYHNTKIKKIFPLADFGHAENEHAVNDTLQSKDLIQSSSSLRSEETDIREREAKASSPPLESKKFESGRVTMILEDANKLIESYGHNKFLEYVERLNDYSLTNQKRFKQYTCHAAVIRTWLKRDNVSKAIKIAPHQEKKPIVVQPSRNLNADWMEGFKELMTWIRLGKIWMDKNWIDFPGLPESKIYYDSYGFQERVLNALRKLDLSLERIGHAKSA